MKNYILNDKFYRKPIKNRKIGILSEWRLLYKGKKDCKKQILRIGTNNEYSSPFFKQEISLCLTAFQKEKEFLSEITMDAQSKISAIELELSKNERQIKSLSSSESNFNQLKRLIGEEALSDDMIKAYRISENNAWLILKNKQIETLLGMSQSLLAEKQRHLLLIEKERDVTEFRCNQLYNILIARLSVYWAGALSGEHETQRMPAIFNIEDLLIDIKSQLTKGDDDNGEKQ